MANKTFKLFADKMGGRQASDYIGTEGEIFYDPTSTTLRVSDGVTAGGTAIGGLSQATDISDPYLQPYIDALAGWQDIVDMSNQQIADVKAANPDAYFEWLWVNWDVTGGKSAHYLEVVAQAWTIQNYPTSPPTELMFKPAITSSLHTQIVTALTAVNNTWNAYNQAFQSKQIVAGDTTLTLVADGRLITPEVIETTVEEDLTIRLRHTAPASHGNPASIVNTDFKFGTNGLLTFPDSTVQTGAAISLAELKAQVAASTDFANFKSRIAAL